MDSEIADLYQRLLEPFDQAALMALYRHSHLAHDDDQVYFTGHPNAPYDEVAWFEVFAEPFTGWDTMRVVRLDGRLYALRATESDCDGDQFTHFWPPVLVEDLRCVAGVGASPTYKTLMSMEPSR